MAMKDVMMADRTQRIGRLITLAAFAIAIAAVIAAPLMALSWSRRPFPGFLVESTLVVESTSASGWSGREAGLRHPYRVTRIGGAAVNTGAEFDAVLAAHKVGDEVSVLALLPDGSTRLFPSVTLIQFPRGDMPRLFWLPYLLGLVYLAIGAWIYKVRGRTGAGLSLAVFCVNAAIVLMLVFDLATTRTAPLIWTVALAQLGGAAINLALRFPEERKPALHRWLLRLPHGISIALAIWGVLVVNDASRPWGYIAAWSASYRYTAIGLIAFVALMLYGARTGRTLLARRQARVVLFGSFLAFVPLSIWFLAPVFNLSIPLDYRAFLPGLLVFPFAVAVAILRYRLLEADTIVHGTVVYGVLTAILAGAFTASIALSQKLFIWITGNQSDAAIIITTLVVASTIAPLRARIEAFINTQLRHTPDRTRDLRQFGERVQAFNRMSEAELLTGQLLEEAVSGLQARSGAVSLIRDGRLRTVRTHGRWTGEAWLSIPLEVEGIRYGMLFLGPSHNGQGYGGEEFEALRQVSAEVARAVRLAEPPPLGIALAAVEQDRDR